MFVFEIADDRMRALQDGKELGAAAVGGLFHRESDAKVEWEAGVCGALSGKVSKKAVKLRIRPSFDVETGGGGCPLPLSSPILPDKPGRRKPIGGIRFGRRCVVA